MIELRCKIHVCPFSRNNCCWALEVKKLLVTSKLIYFDCPGLLLRDQEAFKTLQILDQLK